MSLENEVGTLAPQTERGVHYRPIVDSATEENPIVSPEQAAAQMLGRNEYVQANRKAKMTWDARVPYRDALGHEVRRDRVRGLLNRRAPYIGPFPGGYYWQNFHIIGANGLEVALAEVPIDVEVKGRGRDQRGLVEHFNPRAALAQVQEAMRVAVLSENEYLCEYCMESFVRTEAQNIKEKARHIRTAHAEHFDEWLGVVTERVEKKKAAKAG